MGRGTAAIAWPPRRGAEMLVFAPARLSPLGRGTPHSRGPEAQLCPHAHSRSLAPHGFC